MIKGRKVGKEMIMMQESLNHTKPKRISFGPFIPITRRHIKAFFLNLQSEAQLHFTSGKIHFIRLKKS